LNKRHKCNVSSLQSVSLLTNSNLVFSWLSLNVSVKEVCHKSGSILGEQNDLNLVHSRVKVPVVSSLFTVVVAVLVATGKTTVQFFISSSK